MKRKQTKQDKLGAKAMEKHIKAHMDLFYSEQLRETAKTLGLEFVKIKKFEYLVRKNEK